MIAAGAPIIFATSSGKLVKVKDAKELLELEEQAIELGLPKALIVDRGLTEIPPGTVTCLGIGPAPVEKIDRITGMLKLL